MLDISIYDMDTKEGREALLKKVDDLYSTITDSQWDALSLVSEPAYSADGSKPMENSAMALRRKNAMAWNGNEGVWYLTEIGRLLLEAHESDWDFVKKIYIDMD